MLLLYVATKGGLFEEVSTVRPEEKGRNILETAISISKGPKAGRKNCGRSFWLKGGEL